MAGERFEDLQPLGAGGMGEVLKGRDRALGREVAIKRILPGALDSQEEAGRRFLNEARATGQLEHPNIPPLYEFGRDAEGHPYFALKLVQGESLRALIDRLRQGDPVLHSHYPFTLRLQIFEKVCQAVAYAHQRGVLHRDIKPENIMIGQLGEVFLLDWGLAQTGEGEDSEDFVGTPVYAAPEQLQGGPVDVRTDVYALGATLYEWLSLEPPFREPTLSATLTAVMTREPAAPYTHVQKVQGRMPVEMSYLIMKALQKDPARRLPHVPALLDEIGRILGGDVCPVCPSTTMKFGYHHLARWVDNYPLLVFAVFLWVMYPLYALLLGAFNWLGEHL